MSLLSKAMEKGNCVLYKIQRVPDGVGGFENTYVEDLEFNAAITFDNSTQAKLAEKQGVTSLYTVSTTKNVQLMFHDVFKRLSDDKIFRVTSDGDDKVTPDSASFQIRQVSAEEWKI